MQDPDPPGRLPGTRARARHVALVGLMGAGKTTVGRELARALGWPLRDSDADIEATHGRTVREIRDDLGVEAMHAIEAAHLLAALGEDAPSVICPAASVVDDPGCRAALSAPDVVVVWLHVTPETAARRFAGGPHRPEYGADPVVFLAGQAARRDPQFRALATVEVDTDGETPEAAAGAALAAIRERWELPGADGR